MLGWSHTEGGFLRDVRGRQRRWRLGGCLPLGVAAGAVDESGGAHTRMRSWGKRPGKAVSAGKAAHTRVRCADSRDRGVVCGGRWRRLSGVVRSRGEDFFAERFVGTTGGAVRLFTRGVTHIYHRSQRPSGDSGSTGTWSRFAASAVVGTSPVGLSWGQGGGVYGAGHGAGRRARRIGAGHAAHICHRSQRPGGIAVVQVHGLG